MLLLGKTPGDPTQKTSTAIAPPHGLCLDIGADAFHQLILCPELAKVTQTKEVSDLPPSCGSGSINTNGVTITRFSDSFVDGHINIDGALEKSGFCYDAHGTFHGTVTLSAQGGTVAAHLAVGEILLSVDIPFWCTLLEVVAGPIGVAISDVVSSNIDGAASQLGAVASQLDFGTFGTGHLSGTSFDHVDVVPEGITLNGTATVLLPETASQGINIQGTVTTSNSKVLSEGTFHIGTGCMKGDYPYTETSQDQVGTFIAVPTMLGRPLTLEWELVGFSGLHSFSPPVSTAVLTGKSGTAVLTNVATNFPFPLPGGTIVNQTVHIAYEVLTNLVKLRNVASEGDYSVFLSLKATDPAGNVAFSSKSVQFNGDAVTMAAEYQGKLALCAIQNILELGKLRTTPQAVPNWVGVNFPDPGDLIALIRFLVAVETPEAEAFLGQAKLAHGASFYRALFSPEAAEASAVAPIIKG